MKIIVFPILVFLFFFFQKKWISVSHFSFWFLLFVFVMFAFCFKMLFCFWFSVCSLALFWITILDVLICFLFFFGFCCFVFCYFSNFGHLPKTCFKKLEIPKTPKIKKQNAEKGHFDKSSLHRCVHKIVFCFFLCAFKFCMSCWKHYKNCGFSHPPLPKKNLNKRRISKVKNWSESKSKLKIGPSMLRNQIGPARFSKSKKRSLD